LFIAGRAQSQPAHNGHETGPPPYFSPATCHPTRCHRARVLPPVGPSLLHAGTYRTPPLLLSTGAHRASLSPVSPLLQRVEPSSTFPPLHLLRRTRASKTKRRRLLNDPGDILSTPWCRSSPERGQIVAATMFPPPFHGENHHHSALL
jgi:hypothetical protein